MDPDDNQDDPDGLQERIYVQPREFHIYEFAEKAGQLYVTTPELTMRQMLRRYRDTSTNDVALNRRIVDLDCLEGQLSPANIDGYLLTDVLMSSPVQRMEIVGQRLGQNDEVQDVKSRADKLRALEFSWQRVGMDRVVYVRVAENGAVRFIDYPGDATALRVLADLEPLIDACDDTELINVRKRRGG